MEKLNKTGFLNRFLRAVGACALVLGVASLGGQAYAGSIKNTKHNLGSTGTGSNHLDGSGTAEVCVFCHTPHGADTAAKAPLWNKRLPTSNIYTTYASINSSTLDAQFASDGVGGGSVGSVSVACLSCHDGTQAMDNVINAPGSGGIDATGGGANGRTGAAWTWVTAGARVDAEGIMQAASNGLLGSDLSNDHPIGIQYCGGGPTTAAPATSCVDPDFVAPTVTSGNFYVDTGGAGRQKTDMILYNRTFAAGAGPSVECASCHDVHSENATFLRISNAGSAVCLACHTK